MVTQIVLSQITSQQQINHPSGPNQRYCYRQFTCYYWIAQLQPRADHLALYGFLQPALSVPNGGPKNELGPLQRWTSLGPVAVCSPEIQPGFLFQPSVCNIATEHANQPPLASYWHRANGLQPLFACLLVPPNTSAVNLVLAKILIVLSAVKRLSKSSQKYPSYDHSWTSQQFFLKLKRVVFPSLVPYITSWHL